ncbi:class I SAM-dependent DNA methyltransferase [Shewanella sp. SR44-3]|uniref:type I restriction-modification system subunit M n=1 Tax=Shewanella sp. SR44-3 TaxID=2760936 RepID=UPI0015FD8494|nr:class I SAM-dependent DNA methyltransferase [Shewanella sp. SR44-3]MBB1267913.1 SAM-dependent DNA methyltransferase [Shewanella sp. SR44-3]
MITGQLKSKIDKLWEEFWTGGITNPLTVIEQITFLMYARMLDMNEQVDEKRSARTGQAFNRRFNDAQQHLRWQNIRHLGAEQLYKTVKDELFPYFGSSSAASVKEGNEGSLFSEFMKDAQLMIQKQSLLVKAVEMVNDLPLDNSDTKGDLYEYLLSKLTTAGINGQFRTPRHIIRAMVEMLDPSTTSRICDPASGTGGFLSIAYEYLLEKYTSKDSIEREPLFDEDGKPLLDNQGQQLENVLFSGDLIDPQARQHIDTDMFHGFDFDATMLRVAAMNLVMHGIKQPDVHYQDTLSQRFSENFPLDSKEGFDVILANPPFKGSLDEEDVCPELLRKVKTKKTELLFVALIERMLKIGGQSATIVPDGVLFGSSNAHVQLRQLLVESNQLEAVISLPSGVFKPYAGVSTAILIFTKGGPGSQGTDHVWFYDVQADGFSLDDKRTPIKANDLPDLVAQFKARDKSEAIEQEKLRKADVQGSTNAAGAGRTGTAFWVSKDEIIANKYDLSINRYKEVVHTAEVYDDPKVILAKLKALENDILKDLNELEAML